MKRNAVVFLVFFGGHFLWSIFRASLRNLGKNPSHPPKKIEKNFSRIRNTFCINAL